MIIAGAVLAAVIVAEAAFVLTHGVAQDATVTEESAEAPALSPLHVEGTALVDEAGEPVLFHGVSLGWHNLWPRFYNADCIKSLHSDWGVRIVRAAIGADSHANADNPGCHGGYQTEKDFAMEHLYAVVDACIAEGCYVIIDWHSHKLHPGQSADGQSDLAADFFKEVFQKYKGVPNVIYELYNEPVEDSVEELFAFCDSITSLIPEGEKPLVLMGCPHWDQDIHEVADRIAAGIAPAYDNLMYTVHFYAATHKDYLRDRCDYAMGKGVPVFISECASCECTGDGPMDLESWEQWCSWADSKGVSMLTWSISDKKETCSMFIPEATSGGPWGEEVIKPWGKIVKDWIK